MGNVDEVRKRLESSKACWFIVAGHLCYLSVDVDGKVRAIEYFTVREPDGDHRAIFPLSEKMFNSIDEAIESLKHLKIKKVY